MEALAAPGALHDSVELEGVDGYVRVGTAGDLAEERLARANLASSSDDVRGQLAHHLRQAWVERALEDLDDVAQGVHVAEGRVQDRVVHQGVPVVARGGGARIIADGFGGGGRGGGGAGQARTR